MDTGLELKVHSAGCSQTGSARTDNQDAIRAMEMPSSFGHLYALADGMGGYAEGGLASQCALECFCRNFVKNIHLAPRQNLKRSVEAANLAVFQLAQGLKAGQMGTTLTATYLNGNRLMMAHIGDSRVYRIRQGRVQCLTQDHTGVGDMVRKGQLAPNQLRTHVQRSILNRSLGLELFVHPDLSETTLQSNDWVILCSDGIWSVIHDEEFAWLAQVHAHPDDFTEALVQAALQRQSNDNVTVLAVHIVQAPAAGANSRSHGQPAFLRRWWSSSPPGG